MIIKKRLKSAEDWKQFKNSEDIYKLAEKIMSNIGITAHDTLLKINIGTNAIFEAGNNIIKIYAIAEDRYNPYLDWTREKILSSYLINADFVIPLIIYSSFINDRYCVFYNVFKKLYGLNSLGEVLQNISNPQHQWGMQKLHAVVDMFQLISFQDNVTRKYSKYKNKDKIYYEQPEYKIFLNNYLFEHSPKWGIVHSDLSDTNIYLVSDNIAILDFEDWMYAPLIAEYSALCFDLLKTPASIREYFTHMSSNEICKMLIASILVHYNSMEYLEIIATQMEYNSMGIPSIKLLYNYLMRWLNS